MESTVLTKALLISLYGVVLVFVGILLLWGMMELLVRLTRKREKQPVEEDKALSDKSELTIKQKAAAVAVAAALSLQNSTTISVTPCKQENLSPWQSMHRGYRDLPYRKNTKRGSE